MGRAQGWIGDTAPSLEADISCCYRLDDINQNCAKVFRAHWECLDDNNQQLFQCRKFEKNLLACVYTKLVRLTS